MTVRPNRLFLLGAFLSAQAICWQNFAFAQSNLGPEIPSDADRPPSTPGQVVGIRAPIAVHGVNETSPEELLAVRDDMEWAFASVVQGRGFAQPIADGIRGGGPELDVYLVRSGPPMSVVPDGLAYGESHDCSPVVISLRSGLPAAERRHLLVQAMAEASLWAANARYNRAFRLGMSAAIADRILRTEMDDDALVQLTRNAERGIFAPTTDDREARGTELFFSHLAQRYDNGTGVFWRNLSYMPAVWSPGNARFLLDEPDAFDALRRLLRDERGGLDGFLLDFATAWAITGSPSDPFDVVGWRENDQLAPAPVRTVSVRDMPAWVVSPRPLTTTGVAYVSIDTTGLREGTLNIWFHGARWRRWQLTAVRLDVFDRSRGTAPSPPVNEGEWSTTIELNASDARVLVVMQDMGTESYDPDHRSNRDGLYSLNLSLTNSNLVPDGRSGSVGTRPTLARPNR